MNSPVASRAPRLRADEAPAFGCSMTLNEKGTFSDRSASAEPSLEPSTTAITSKPSANVWRLSARMDSTTVSRRLNVGMTIENTGAVSAFMRGSVSQASQGSTVLPPTKPVSLGRVPSRYTSSD
jgi:hypothetical protein